MKVLVLSALLTIAGLSAARAACPNNSDVQYAASYLALVESTGGDVYGPVGVVVTSDELCQSLKSYSVLQSNYSGYHEVVLNFADQTCSLQLKPAGNGKYSDIFLESCEK